MNRNQKCHPSVTSRTSKSTHLPEKTMHTSGFGGPNNLRIRILYQRDGMYLWSDSGPTSGCGPTRRHRAAAVLWFDFARMHRQKKGPDRQDRTRGE